MVRDQMPVLIDFGSSRPFGQSLPSYGTRGWYEERDGDEGVVYMSTSNKEHDYYAIARLRKWLENPISMEEMAKMP